MNLTLKHNILKLGQIPDFVNPCSQQSQQYLNALKSSYYDVISIFFTHVTVHHSDFNLQYPTCDFKFGSVRNPTLFLSRRFFNSQLWYYCNIFAPPSCVAGFGVSLPIFKNSGFQVKIGNDDDYGWRYKIRSCLSAPVQSYS